MSNLEEFTPLLKQTLAIDIETHPISGQILQIGAIFQQQVFNYRGNCSIHSLMQLEEFAHSANYIVGHNILLHDLPILRQACLYLGIPELKLFDKPLIDTLFLSPLAFPQVTYHHLIKEYKSTFSSKNQPTLDAEQSLKLLEQQFIQFNTLKNQQPALLAFYRFCFHQNIHYSGIEHCFATMQIPLVSNQAAKEIFKRKFYKIVCNTTLKEFLKTDFNQVELAYLAAWLSVAEQGQPLPIWVHHQFPNLRKTINILRSIPCDKSDCVYCQQQFNPVAQLQKFFHFPAFRPTPATPEGESLQQAIVHHALRANNLLGILPTGAGKSICYQLPALVAYQQTGALTIVISPLQALMRDQVANLTCQTDSVLADELSGLLTTIERKNVLERVRTGKTAILFVAPEQLRNESFLKTIEHRQIHAWVFDEAHCLAKWGHDFRPDYLYAGIFIQKLMQAGQNSLIWCFTATAKLEVLKELKNYFKQLLNIELAIFEGGVERNNLDFTVREIARHEKKEAIYQVLKHQLTPEMSIVVYTATQKATEELAKFLNQQNLPVQIAAFHADIDSLRKREIQEAFSRGEIGVICATNAFGMGIDKSNIRFVIHADIPGSLENYLQEAGRAGRDQQAAKCILFYHNHDIETQFKLNARNQLTHKEIIQILRALRKFKRKENLITVTSNELINQSNLEIEASQKNADTKIKTALAWLEQAGFIKRHFNYTQVFQGKPRLSLELAEQVLTQHQFPIAKKKLCLALTQYLIENPYTDAINADILAEQLAIESPTPAILSAAQYTLRLLNELSSLGILQKSTSLSAIIRPIGKQNAGLIFNKIRILEKAFLALLREQAPDAIHYENLPLHLRIINQQLLDNAHDSSLECLKRILSILSQDAKNTTEKHSSINLKLLRKDLYAITVNHEWSVVEKRMEMRYVLAENILQILIAKAKQAISSTEKVEIEFDYDALIQPLKQKFALENETQWVNTIESILLFLHEQKVLFLQNGSAIFRQAMNIEICAEAKGRKYSKTDFSLLQNHYSEKTFQIHIMQHYAKLGLQQIQSALGFVLDYFNLEKSQLIKRYFPQQKELLSLPTSEQSIQTIVHDLQHETQIEIVTAPLDENILILAGAGAGKTRVVVHRCAYLIRVQRVSAQSILVLCFNRQAAITLRKRLYSLIGYDALSVTILTYHSFAMRLLGFSFKDKSKDDINFKTLLKDAVALLKGEKTLLGLEDDEQRERLLAGYRFILVDEYQDVDEEQYQLISAIAGRTENEQESKLNLLAVGDDDQNIYSFRGANIAYIRKFEEDYKAKSYYLVENYRSTVTILNAANQLIAHNQDRMKVAHELRVNQARQIDIAGGIWQTLDKLAQGKVQCLQVADESQQAFALLAELQRLQQLSPQWHWSDCAILVSSWQELNFIRYLLTVKKIPLFFPNEFKNQSLPITKIREFAQFLVVLKQDYCRKWTITSLKALLVSLKNKETIWWVLLENLLDNYAEEIMDSEVSSAEVLEFIYETALQETKAIKYEGVYCSTVHSVKGLEFKHVFILDGFWHAENITKLEEQRRVFYVGMTRAQQTLCLFQRKDRRNPFIAEITDLYKRPVSIVMNAEQQALLACQFATLGMKEMMIGFAGKYEADAPIHSIIAQLNAGDSVSLFTQSNNILVRNRYNEIVGQLAKETASQWKHRLSHITAAKVVAIVQRTIDEEAESFRTSKKCAQWEVVLVEIEYSLVPVATKSLF